MINYSWMRDQLLKIEPLAKSEFYEIIISRFLSANYHGILNARVRKKDISSLKNRYYLIDFNVSKIDVLTLSYIKSFLMLMYLSCTYTLQIMSCIFFKYINYELRGITNVNLFFGLTREQMSFSKKYLPFEEYLSKFSVDNHLCKTFVVQSNNQFFPKLINRDLILCKSPNLLLYVMNNPNYSLFTLFLRCFLEFFTNLFRVFFRPTEHFIIQDIFLEKWLWDKVNKQNVNLLISPNNLFVQPINFRCHNKGVKRFMVWYAASAIRYSSTQLYLDESFYQFLPIDIHLVWTLQHKKYLDKITNSTNRVIGPQLFYLANGTNLMKFDGFTIAIMDITPTFWELYRETPYGVDRCMWFVTTVIEVVEELRRNSSDIPNLRLDFKYKRDPSDIHASQYLTYVKKHTENKIIDIIPSDINLFDYFGKIDLLITTKLTSVGIVAESVGCPVIYFEHKDYSDWFSGQENIITEKKSLKSRILHEIQKRAREDSNL